MVISGMWGKPSNRPTYERTVVFLLVVIVVLLALQLVGVK